MVWVFKRQANNVSVWCTYIFPSSAMWELLPFFNTYFLLWFQRVRNNSLTVYFFYLGSREFCNVSLFTSYTSTCFFFQQIKQKQVVSSVNRLTKDIKYSYNRPRSVFKDFSCDVEHIEPSVSCKILVLCFSSCYFFS